MTINEMYNELENKVRDTYIVTLKYKYDFEEKYTIENQILVYDSMDDSYVWLNDWNEGQTDIEVLGYMLLGDVDATQLLTCEDCISRAELKKWLDMNFSFGGALRKLKLFERLDKELPSVQPQGVEQIKWERDTAINQLKELGYGFGEKVESKKNHGKWIGVHSEEEDGFPVYECSQCGCLIFSESEADRKKFHSWCGACGADMRGENNEME